MAGRRVVPPVGVWGRGGRHVNSIKKSKKKSKKSKKKCGRGEKGMSSPVKKNGNL